MEKYKIVEIEVNNINQKFIKEMTYQAIHVNEGNVPPSRDILEDPKLKKYYTEFGKESDLGYIAMDKESKKNIGAIWLRQFTGENRGWGYVDDSTPELSMAVLENYRGIGIGTALLEHMLNETEKRYPDVSLSVDPENRALKLYKRCGFIEYGKEGSSIIMLLKRD